MNEDPEPWPRLNALSRLTVAHLESGRVTREVDQIVDACSTGMRATEISMINMGRAVILQHGDGQGRVIARTSSVTVSNSINCERVRRLDETSQQVASGELSPRQLDDRLDQILSARSPWYVGTLGAALLAGFIAMQIGVGPGGAVFAALLHLATGCLGVAVQRLRVAPILLVAAQSLTGALIAFTAAATGVVPWVPAVAALAVSWVLLVPLPSLVACFEDAVQAEHPAAFSRGAVVLGAVVGVVVAGAVFVRLSTDVAPDDFAAPELPVLAAPFVVLFSGLGALANVFANGGGRRLVVPATVIGAATGVVNLFFDRFLGLDEILAKFLVATLLGLCLAYAAPRLGYPSAVLVLMGITGALLPGLVLYSGLMAQLQFAGGAAEFVRVGLICFALGAGTALGTTIAHRLPWRPRHLVR